MSPIHLANILHLVHLSVRFVTMEVRKDIPSYIDNYVYTFKYLIVTMPNRTFSFQLPTRCYGLDAVFTRMRRLTFGAGGCHQSYPRSDCCLDTCTDGEFECGVSSFFCEDPTSRLSHFCDKSWDDFVSPPAWDYWANATIGNDTRAHVCANCNPLMENLFYTIGKASPSEHCRKPWET